MDERIEKMLNGDLKSDHPFIQYLIEQIIKGREDLHGVQLAKAKCEKDLAVMQANGLRLQGGLGKHIDDLRIWVARVDEENPPSSIAAVPND